MTSLLANLIREGPERMVLIHRCQVQEMRKVIFSLVSYSVAIELILLSEVHGKDLGGTLMQQFYMEGVSEMWNDDGDDQSKISNGPSVKQNVFGID